MQLGKDDKQAEALDEETKVLERLRMF